MCYQTVILDGVPPQLTLDLQDIQGLVNPSEGNLYWFVIAGNNITLSGNQDLAWGFVDSFGHQWWEAARPTPLEDWCMMDLTTIFLLRDSHPL